ARSPISSMSSPRAAPTPPSPLRYFITRKRASDLSNNISSNEGYRYACKQAGPFQRTMLIPSIDLQGGAVVQLIQGDRLAIRDEDVFRWVRRFSRFPKVQVIDLDAATGAGDNLALVRQIAASLTCRVGGGIRTIERAREVLAAGAEQIIAGSSLFKDGQPDLAFAKALADDVGVDRVIAAVDSRGGQVVIHGWR